MTTLHEPSGTRIWDRCEELARFSEETGALTRVFLSREQERPMTSRLAGCARRE